MKISLDRHCGLMQFGLSCKMFTLLIEIKMKNSY